jgi:glutamate carboxypeptidase
VELAWEFVKDWRPDPEGMADRVAGWAAVNSWTRNPEGVAALARKVRDDFAALGGSAEFLELPPMATVGSGGMTEFMPLAPALRMKKRPDAPVRALLVGHLDTVFPPEHPFRAVSRAGEELRGPGVADCKGGLAVLLAALEALEQSPWADRLGWEVWLASDEEVGSPGSSSLLRGVAERCRLGLVFEPGFPDGALVARRKGSGNFTAVMRGRSAHAGRNPEEGRNAIHALASFVVDLVQLDGQGDGITVNVGRIGGGEAENVVPDLAIGRFNVRLASPEDQTLFQTHLEGAVGSVAAQDGIRLELHGGIARPPWRGEGRCEALREALSACSRRLGHGLAWRSSGGASDANLLAAAGLPVADGLGPWSEGTHTDRERIDVASLGARARLAALLLVGIASGGIPLPEA